MTFPIKGNSYQRKVVFKKREKAGSLPSRSSAQSILGDIYVGKQTQQPGFVTEPLTPEAVLFPFANASSTMSAKTAHAALIPDLFTSVPPIRDLKSTATLQVQEKTILECLPFLNGMEGGLEYNAHGVPHLDRQRHIAFLHKSLKPLPSAYVAADASRPWMFYWILAALSTLGEDVSPYRERLIATVMPIQNPTGGFGGGNGQMSHLAPTYAVLLSLVIVGGNEALDLIDRKAMWQWLGNLKHPNGGFRMAVGGEVDVR
jgi:protein farnesyltransferase subunit beta